MVDSLFVLSTNGVFVLERHFQNPLPRSICEPFLDCLDDVRNAARSPERRRKKPSIDQRSPTRRKRRLNPRFESRCASIMAEIPNVMRSNNPKTALIHIVRDRMVYIGVVTKEVQPLLVLELLSRIHGVLSRYLAPDGPMTDDVLRQNFSTAYLLIDEMIDSSGMPFTTELNSLENIIDPPSAVRKLTQVVAGGTPHLLKSDTAAAPVVPSHSGMGGHMGNQANSQAGQALGSLWNGLTSTVGAALGTTPSKIGGPTDEIWWRKADAVYTTNEIYLDAVDRIDGIVAENGALVSGGIVGEIRINSKLSGAMPEVTIAVTRDAQKFKAASFHPCVRVAKFERDNVLAFVPPDGAFTLSNYYLPCQQSLPLPFSLQGRILYHSDSAVLEIDCGPKLSITRQAQVMIENFFVEVKVPDAISAVMFDSVGKFDERTSSIQFNVGKLENRTVLKASMRYRTDPATNKAEIPNEEKSVANVRFHVKGWSASNLRLDAMDVLGVPYTPYKACRYSSTNGNLEFRL